MRHTVPHTIAIFYRNSMEALINSEIPQHMEVLPFSMADKSLKMKEKVKSHFTFFVLR